RLALHPDVGLGLGRVVAGPAQTVPGGAAEGDGTRRHRSDSGPPGGASLRPGGKLVTPPLRGELGEPVGVRPRTGRRVGGPHPLHCLVLVHRCLLGLLPILCRDEGGSCTGHPADAGRLVPCPLRCTPPPWPCSSSGWRPHRSRRGCANATSATCGPSRAACCATATPTTSRRARSSSPPTGAACC